jgi:hypothetical protein
MRLRKRSSPACSEQMQVRHHRASLAKAIEQIAVSLDRIDRDSRSRAAPAHA